MGFDRRMLGLLLLVAIVGLPALVLRLTCAGHACDEPSRARADIPFCSLPDRLRAEIENGFREGRSPDVLAVTGSVEVSGSWRKGRSERGPTWPGLGRPVGRGVLVVGPGGSSPEAPPGDIPVAGFDDVAPTLARFMGLERPHPEVRSGVEIAEVAAPTEAVDIVLQIVWKGLAPDQFTAIPEDWTPLADLEAGSLPKEPTAFLTTIGTGALPRQHGITGALVRNDDGRLVEAWGQGSPPTVVAALGDDLDELTGQGAQIALVASDASDRGLIGADWYVDHDRDRVVIAKRPDLAAASVRKLLRTGLAAADKVLLAVSMQGLPADLNDATEKMVRATERAAEGRSLLTVLIGVPTTPPGTGLKAADVAEHIDGTVGAGTGVVEAAVPGGLYLDQRALAREEIPEDEVVRALRTMEDGAGNQVFSDVFPAIAVSFGRYC